MWNCSAPSSSMLLPFGDDYVKCEPSNAPAGTAGFDKMLATDYDLCHHMSFSPSFQSLQSPTLFSNRYLEESSIYSAGARPAFAQFSYAQPTTAIDDSVKWTPAGEPIAGDGGVFRGSKRLKTTTKATPKGPRNVLQCNKPRNKPVKTPCKRSQKLGDKITVLQQLVSPYGKTDTASVLHEAASCIRHLHEQIQVLTTASDGASTELRWRGLCVAPLSPAVVSLVSDAARGRATHYADTEDRRSSSWFTTL